MSQIVDNVEGGQVVLPKNLQSLKTSFLTGEFWMFLLAGMVMLYLDSKGMTVDDLAKRGDVFVAKVQEAASEYKYIIMATIFGVKRMMAKITQMILLYRVAVERLRLELRR